MGEILQSQRHRSSRRCLASGMLAVSRVPPAKNRKEGLPVHWLSNCANTAVSRDRENQSSFRFAIALSFAPTPMIISYMFQTLSYTERTRSSFGC